MRKVPNAKTPFVLRKGKGTPGHPMHGFTIFVVPKERFDNFIDGLDGFVTIPSNA